jgi:hypothetical protein
VLRAALTPGCVISGRVTGPGLALNSLSLEFNTQPSSGCALKFRFFERPQLPVRRESGFATTAIASATRPSETGSASICCNNKCRMADPLSAFVPPSLAGISNPRNVSRATTLELNPVSAGFHPHWDCEILLLPFQVELISLFTMLLGAAFGFRNDQSCMTGSNTYWSGCNMPSFQSSKPLCSDFVMNIRYALIFTAEVHMVAVHIGEQDRPVRAADS